VPLTRFVKSGTLCLICLPLVSAQQERASQFRVNVDMVTLTFTVTDGKGKYVRGLKPGDLLLREDGIPQKIAGFAEGAEPMARIGDMPPDALGTKIFVLFDTSNWMYAGFPYASDAIADFVRRLDETDSVAIYKFSRNLFRAVSPTGNRERALSAARNSVAGDETALFNCLLLTLRDASKAAGRKAIVVFSNGPDTASIVSPDDIGAVAEDEGIPIYVVSTADQQKNPALASALRRLTERTGGRLFWAWTWKKQADAFTSIRESLASSYTVAYYPAPNPNRGFRKIGVEVVGDKGKKYRIRARAGYHAPVKP
jgi:VWFA-related protein